MGIKKVFKSRVDGVVDALSSKSVMQRAVILSLLAKGETTIENPSFADDCIAALELVMALGIKKLEDKDKIILIHENEISEKKRYELSCGESGLLMRMISPVLSLFDGNFQLGGRGSLLKRPVDMIEDGLKKLGVNCKSNSGFAPIEISGKLRGGDITVDGSISSQFISGLLIALPKCKEDSIVKVNNLKSKAYIDLTVETLKKAGVIVDFNGLKNEYIIKGNQVYKPLNIRVDGDWSGVSFLLIAAALTGKIKIINIDTESLQADRVILEVLKLAGARVKIGKNFVKVKKDKLNAFEFDITESPDLFPPIVSLAAFCEGKSVIYGIERLKYKESSRAEAMQEELRKLGIELKLYDNRAEILGREKITVIFDGEINSHNDHRIAMAFAVIGLNLKNGLTISGSESVSKSYPNFFEDLKRIGGRLK